MNVRVYKPSGYKGVAEKVKDPAWTTVLGLLEYSAEAGIDMTDSGGGAHPGLLSGLMAKISGLFGHKDRQ